MFNIGIIGCGKIAQVRHIPEYAAHPAARLTGYYDLNQERAQALAAQWGGLPHLGGAAGRPGHRRGEHLRGQHRPRGADHRRPEGGQACAL